MTATIPRRVEPPALRCGEGFKVRSHSGKHHALVFLARGDGDAGLFVRMGANRLARLDPERVRWDTCQVTPHSVPALRLGDEVIVESTRGGAMRATQGTIASLSHESVSIETSTRLHLIAWDSVRRVDLLFSAPSLQRGDPFVVRSLSGTRYRGTVIAICADRIGARLDDGREARMRLERLELTSLKVLVPLDLAPLRAQLQRHCGPTWEVEAGGEQVEDH